MLLVQALVLPATYPGNFALNFSATHRDVVRVPHSEMMNHPLIDSWTLEAWVYPFSEQKHPGDGKIITIVGFPERHPMLGMTYDGFAVAQLMDAKGKWYTYQGTTSLKAGWHHLAATWDGRSEHPADNKFSLYVDGVLEVAGGDLDDGTGEPKTPGTHGYTAANQCTAGLCEEGMHIGGLYCCQGGGYTGRFFSGAIDEVRVWTRELPPQEITSRMHTPLQAQDQQQLLFYFPLDDAGMEMGSNVVESKALEWCACAPECAFARCPTSAPRPRAGPSAAPSFPARLSPCRSPRTAETNLPPATCRYGLRGTSTGLGRPAWSVSNSPLTYTAGSRAPACTTDAPMSSLSSAPWFASGKGG